MAEVIGPGDARIKFAAQRTGDLRLSPAALPALGRLAALMHRLEACGMVPILDDGLVGGNCGIVASATCSERSDGSDSGGGSRSTAAGAAESGGGAEGGRSSSGGGGALQGGVLISRSGKPPGHTLQAGDWVLLRRFDPGGWSAEYESATEAARPSSDAPLHAAALGPGAARRYGWAEAPAVAVHGHALAEGPGGCAAAACGAEGPAISRSAGRQARPAAEPATLPNSPAHPPSLARARG